MRILQTAVFVATFALFALYGQAQGLRTSTHTAPQAPFALEHPRNVRLAPPAPAIPYTTGNSVFESIPARGAIVFSKLPGRIL